MAFKIYLAKPRGFCAGVERAIRILELSLEKFGAPIYVRHAIVHNERVVSEFEKKGVIFVEDIEEIPEGSIVVFSAHGVSPEIKEKAKRRNLKVIDATCPLVEKVHIEAKNYADKGYTIFLIGHKNHVETRGTVGEAPNKIIIIENENDLKNLEGKNFEKIAILTQTTLSVDDSREIIEKIKERFKNVEKPRIDDICYATQNRQDAVKKIAPFVDIFLIVGSKESSNSNRLKEIAERYGAKAFLINNRDEIPENINDVKAVGVTSGASTPENIVNEIIERLQELGANEIIEIEGTEEKIRFQLPKELA